MSNLHRIQWIDAALRENCYPNCASIAKQFEISVRQASRDVDYLKYSLGAPVEYSFARRGYYYAEPTFVLPSLFIGEEEKEALHYLADRYRAAGGDATAKLAAFFEKLSPGGAPARAGPSAEVPVYVLKAGQVRTYHLMQEAAAAVPFRGPTDTTVDPDKVPLLVKNLKECRALEKAAMDELARLVGMEASG